MTPRRCSLPDASTVRRILVIRRRGLGDALVSLPAVAALADAFPRADLDLLVDRPFAPLIAHGLARGSVVPWPPREGDGDIAWLPRLRAAGYDLVLDLLSTPRTAVWTALSGARWRLGYDLPGRSWAYNIRIGRNASDDGDLHQFAGESFLDALRALGRDPDPWREPRLEPQPDERLDDTYRRWRDDAGVGVGRDVALVLSAGWPAKGWPEDNAADLWRMAHEHGYRIVFVPGPGDAAIEARLRERIPDLVAAPPTGLDELADLLRRCRAYVGTDGGARHVAAAVGTPTCTVFGPTDPRGWNRAQPRHVAVRTGEDCSPCDLTRCPIEGHPCMTGLSGATVWEATERILSAAREEKA